jgi:tRNA/tmRNA/rRNA uracil-C5-methylase (TrmA/RlmC/RlmD family)
VTGLEPGVVLERVEVGPVAHGGHFVVRHEGRVVFVRHALTGEQVDVRITEVNRRFARGDAVAVHRPSPHRVVPPCPIAGRCGGCDFQHVEPAHARELKRRVVAELLGHLAGYEFPGEVEEVQPAPLGWRRRMRYTLDDAGRPGLRAYRSSEVVPLPDGGCRIADPGIADPLPDPSRPGGQLLGVAAADGVVWLTADGRSAEVAGKGSVPVFDQVAENGDRPLFRQVGSRSVTERVGELSFQVAADGFWQAHAAAPDVLVGRMLAGLQPKVGEVALDLYCGVGLFAAALVAAGASVWGVEGDRRAVELAAANVPQATFVAGDVARRVSRLPERADLVVLDPPRTGAGADVIAAVARRRPRAIAYVACDPAALGRDLRTAGELGYHATSVTAHDLFPMTHHVECVAILEPR